MSSFVVFLNKIFLKSSVEMDIKAFKIIVHLQPFKMVFFKKLYLLLVTLQSVFEEFLFNSCIGKTFFIVFMNLLLLTESVNEHILCNLM